MCKMCLRVYLRSLDSQQKYSSQTSHQSDNPLCCRSKRENGNKLFNARYSDMKSSLIVMGNRSVSKSPLIGTRVGLRCLLWRLIGPNHTQYIVR